MTEIAIEYLELVVLGLNMSSQSELIVKSLITVSALQRSDVMSVETVLFES